MAEEQQAAEEQTDIEERLPPKQKRFLEVWKETHVVKAAAETVGVERSTPYRWRRENPDFAKAWERAELEVAEDLEEVARARAKEKSDLLLMFLLKAYKPDKFRETPQGQANQVNVSIELPPDLEDMKVAGKSSTVGELPSGGDEPPA